MSKELCPRCGSGYNYIERRDTGKRVYLYAVHYLGKGKKRKCYLGPEGDYEYVSRLHEDLGIFFRGLNDSDRLVKYVYILTARLLRARLKPDQARAIASHLEEVARNLRIEAAREEFEGFK